MDKLKFYEMIRSLEKEILMDLFGENSCARYCIKLGFCACDKCRYGLESELNDRR